MIQLGSTKVQTAIDDFAQRGFAVVEACDRDALDAVRAAVHASASATAENEDAQRFMNGFHELGLSGSELNDYRLRTYREFNRRVDAGQLIWNAFRDTLTALIGPDVCVQRQVNLVIQPPHDTNNSPVHRDAPPNSVFEIVAWVPLVDCYGTKGMQVLDLRQTEHALTLLDGSAGDYDALCRFALEHGAFAEVAYGSALLFWTPLFHAIPINAETETRWSLNLRYKSPFTPYGAKGFPDYFRILELSPLSRAAIESERRTRLGAASGPAR